MSIKAIGIAIKLTMEGWSQVAHFQTWIFVMVAISCIIIQLNYLNKVISTSVLFKYSRDNYGVKSPINPKLKPMITVNLMITLTLTLTYGLGSSMKAQ